MYTTKIATLSTLTLGIFILNGCAGAELKYSPEVAQKLPKDHALKYLQSIPVSGYRHLDCGYSTDTMKAGKSGYRPYGEFTMKATSSNKISVYHDSQIELFGVNVITENKKCSYIIKEGSQKLTTALKVMGVKIAK